MFLPDPGSLYLEAFILTLISTAAILMMAGRVADAVSIILIASFALSLRVF